MGINTNGSNIIWKAKSVSTRELREMINFSKGTQRCDNICIDVDLSNVAHILALKSPSYERLLENTARYLKDLAVETGFHVTAVLDGDIRPQSKRDSFRRRFDSYMGLINGSYCRRAAMALSAKEDKTACDKAQLDVLNAEAKKLDKKRLFVAPGFHTDLKSKLEEIKAHEQSGSTGGYVCKNVIKAEFQADYIMAYRFRNDECDLILSTDMDFSALAGPRCICMKSYNIMTEKVNSGQKRKKNIEKQTSCMFELGGGSNMHMIELKKKIGDNFG